AGIEYGTLLRITGEGVRKRGNVGSLLVRIIIAIPKKISSEQRELYEKLIETEQHSKSINNQSNPDKKKKHGFFGF
ncbi:MAG TPA: molecular chaperone DnaJ, partial [Methanocorpusculum sp.]|nr:molecular chaperone DnaJ [Methanocorpusculum sp.]